mgnify:CR=1|jgi:hypothetical protein
MYRSGMYIDSMALANECGLYSPTTHQRHAAFANLQALRILNVSYFIFEYHINR